MDAKTNVLREISDNICTNQTESGADNDPKQTKKRRVAYVFNEEYLKLCDKLPKVKNRVRNIFNMS